MKRKILPLAILCAILMLFTTSCFSLFDCDVTYDYCGAGENVTITVPTGSFIPNDKPEREGYVFGGWYEDKDYKISYDFEYPIESSMTLYAKWIKKEQSDFDAEALINTISTKTIRATLMFSVEKYDLSGGFFSSKQNISTSTGSGVIFAEEGGYYFALTNNHVIAKGNKTNADITVYDYKVGKHTAELVAQDANYDLAVVRFKCNAAAPLEVLDVSSEETAIDETVIAVGSPGGQMNTITFGKVLAKETVSVDPGNESTSNVTFPVLRHDAPMDNGSSGGVLLDTKLNIAGINFAAASNGGEFVYGYAVSSAKVTEFLASKGLIKE